MSLEGEANVQWAISGKETASYFGHQQYLYTRASVSDNNFDFRAGTHIYVFNLRIPRECPSSCSGPYGCIGYNISLVIDRPHCFNEVFRQPIYVVQTLNLNSNPDFAVFPLNFLIFSKKLSTIFKIKLKLYSFQYERKKLNISANGLAARVLYVLV